MAVKRKKVLAPPIYQTGGKEEHYAIEVLNSEYTLIMSRVKEARAEKYFYKSKERKLDVQKWLSLAEQLKTGIIILNAARRGAKKPPASIATPEQKVFIDPEKEKMAANAAAGLGIEATAIASCKHFAKCGQFSYWYCFSKCEKRKTKECTLVRKYTRRKKAT